MKNIKISKRTIIIFIALFVLLLFSIILITKIKSLPAKTKGTDIDKSLEIYDTEFRQLDNVDIFFSVYDVFLNSMKKVVSDEEDINSSVFDLLDDQYKKYYDVSKKNINEKISKYKNMNFVVKNIMVAITSGNFATYLVDTECNSENYKFIIRVDYSTLAYSMYLPDFIEEYGMENYVSNLLVTEKNIKVNNENKFNYLSLSSEDILIKYSNMMKKLGFEYVYNNYISDQTKANYSKEELSEFFKNENTFFNRPVFVELLENKNVNNSNTSIYSFKDRKMNEYEITIKDIIDIKLTINIVPEETDNNEAEGLLEIIGQ